MNRQLSTLLAIAIMVASSLPVAGDDWIALFNGSDLAGWKVNEHAESVYVEDGTLVTNGLRAHAFFVGNGEDSIFRDFHLRAEMMTRPHSNSGIYFHTRYLAAGWPDRGYEAQVNNTHADPCRTGGLYAVEDHSTAPVPDNEWFTYEVIVRGKRIITRVNGTTIVDYTEPPDLDRPERQLSEGLIALQAHDPDSKVIYRKIEVLRLD